MKHIDIWHDIVARNSSLSLILEDDAVFVSNFPEKFNRTIFTAIRTGALKSGGLVHCVNDKQRLPEDSNEWFEQDPMIGIGGCFNLHDKAFAKNRSDASPMLSTHKKSASRCTHAYLLTACSAQALIRQSVARKTRILETDFYINAHGAASPTLQMFWLDPPIVYQGNQIYDLDGIPSFKRKTY
jgi:GR25 family glycosyltransferase involved in LPS biosynthesis